MINFFSKKDIYNIEMPILGYSSKEAIQRIYEISKSGVKLHNILINENNKSNKDKVI